jgi:hypothetical protein
MKRSLSVLAVGLLLAACNDAPAMTESGDLFFPTQEGPRSGMQALYRGPLVVRDGCVLIGGPDDYTVPIWPNGFAVEPDESGRVVVRDSEGTVVAIDGETFEMGGGFTVEFRPRDKVEPRDAQLQRLEEWLGYAIPERCLGPDVYGVWIVGET